MGKLKVSLLICGALLAVAVSSAQTSTQALPPCPTNTTVKPTKPCKPVVVAPAKPAVTTPPKMAVTTPPKPAVAQSVAAKTATTNAVPQAKAPLTNASQIQPISGTATPTASTPSSGGLMNHVNSYMGSGNSSAAGSSSVGASAASSLPPSGASSVVSSATTNPADPRAPVGGLGVGNFEWPGGWTLTAYGCFRTGTRLFCDFDTTNQNNQQAAASIWSGAGGVNVVDDGGKITTRHNAFFVGTDGSQFQNAYISPQPVRFVIEYDDVNPRYTSVSLVLTSNRIQAVPVTTIDPSQPAGTIPARAAAAAPAPGTASAAAAAAQPGQAAPPGSTIDQTQQKIDNGKAKAKSLWNSLTTK